MRYKVGDKVQVKSATDIPESCPTEHGEVVTFGDMLKWCGQTVTIARVLRVIYLIAEDDGQNSWAEDMFQTKSNISSERRKRRRSGFWILPTPSVRQIWKNGEKGQLTPKDCCPRLPLTHRKPKDGLKIKN